MLVPVLLFIAGLILLIKGGDWFVDGATAVAHKFHIPEILIGATVVSIGTTLPEVMVSATSAVGGHGEIAYGNAIGSVICNAALIAAITIAIKPGKTDTRSLKLPVFFFFGTAIFYSAVAYIFGFFYRPVGFILLAIFIVYMIVSVRRSLKESAQNVDENEKEEAPEDKKGSNTVKDFAMLIVGAALIAVGANLLVDNGIIIAEKAGVPESVIALTFVALGTSLPELVTAITSLAKGHGALSLGNVIGANLFNLVLVSGVSTALSPFAVPNNTSLTVDIPVMFGVMIVLTVPTLVKGKLSRWQGIVLLAAYASFCVFQFI